MARTHSIIYATPIPECWTNLKKFCNHYGLKYNTIAKYELPIEFEGYLVHRVKDK
jgi:hypothetical protein